MNILQIVSSVSKQSIEQFGSSSGFNDKVAGGYRYLIIIIFTVKTHSLNTSVKPMRWS